MAQARHARSTRAAASPDAAEQGIVARAVRAAQAGERDALGFLYARYAEDVCGYLRSIVRDEHEAEDLTQQAFVKLARVIGKYEPREVPFLAWMLRVSRNIALDHLRAQRCVPCEEIRTGEDAEAPALTRGATGTARAVERASELRAALAALPAEQREVLMLRHLAGLSPGEIAARTGRSEGSIHGLHHRGRRALQADLRSRGLAPAVSPGS